MCFARRGPSPPKKIINFIDLQFPYPTRRRSSFSENMIDSKNGPFQRHGQWAPVMKNQKTPGLVVLRGGTNNCERGMM